MKLHLRKIDTYLLPTAHPVVFLLKQDRNVSLIWTNCETKKANSLHWLLLKNFRTNLFKRKEIIYWKQAQLFLSDLLTFIRKNPFSFQKRKRHDVTLTFNLFSRAPRYISLGIKFKEVGNAITIIMSFSTVIVWIHLWYYMCS